MDTVTAAVAVDRFSLCSFLCVTYSEFSVLSKSVRLGEAESLAWVVPARVGIMAGRRGSDSFTLRLQWEAGCCIPSRLPFGVPTSVHFLTILTVMRKTVQLHVIPEKWTHLLPDEKRILMCLTRFQIWWFNVCFIYLEREMLPCLKHATTF